MKHTKKHVCGNCHCFSRSLVTVELTLGSKKISSAKGSLDSSVIKESESIVFNVLWVIFSSRFSIAFSKSLRVLFIHPRMNLLVNGGLVLSMVG